LIEVAGDGLAARIDDFKKLRVWGGRTRTLRYRGDPKGHAGEMDGLVALVEGRPSPESSFVTSLWSTLATCRAARSILTGHVQPVRPDTTGLALALGGDPAPRGEGEAGRTASSP